MILNVSGRCDICAFFSTWLMNRFKAGYVDVRNPFYHHQVSRILLDKENIDAIIFCTKNPLPMLPYLDELAVFPYMFQITLTAYRQDLEPNVLNKREIIKAIIELSDKIGSERVMVRYDPILINEEYTLEYHLQMFERLCKQLQGYVSGIIISFIDMKKNPQYYALRYGLRELSKTEIDILAEAMGKCAKKYHLSIQTCGEDIDLSDYGFLQQSCITVEKIYHLTGKAKRYPLSRQRRGCKCLQSVDIGYYNCCPHFCRYCYANYDEKQVPYNFKQHDPASSLLIGHLCEEDDITIRKK